MRIETAFMLYRRSYIKLIRRKKLYDMGRKKYSERYVKRLINRHKKIVKKFVEAVENPKKDKPTQAFLAKLFLNEVKGKMEHLSKDVKTIDQFTDIIKTMPIQESGLNYDKDLFNALMKEQKIKIKLFYTKHYESDLKKLGNAGSEIKLNTTNDAMRPQTLRVPLNNKGQKNASDMFNLEVELPNNVEQQDTKKKKDDLSMELSPRFAKPSTLALNHGQFSALGTSAPLANIANTLGK